MTPTIVCGPRRGSTTRTAWLRPEREHQAMTDAGSRCPLDRSPWNQRWVWWALAFVALGLHYAIGPMVVFPVLLVVPIMLVAWHAGPRGAVGFTVVLSAIRFGFGLLWSPPWSLRDAALNALVHGGPLVVVALLAAHGARLRRATRLEGLVPICAFCKRIRDEHHEWTPLEAYITARSAVTFSHGICPECITHHYGALFADNRNAE